MSPSLNTAGQAPEERVAQWIATRYSFVDRIWVFGSRATGRARPRSDIDLAIECSQASEAEWIRLANDVDEESPGMLTVDVVRLESAPDELRDKILKTRRLLYDRNRAQGSL